MTASKELLEAAEHLAAARALNEKTTTETKTLDSAIMASSDGTYQLCFSGQPRRHRAAWRIRQDDPRARP